MVEFTKNLFFYVTLWINGTSKKLYENKIDCALNPFTCP